MRLALQAPERVSRLILIDTSAAAEAMSKRIQYAALSRAYGLVGFHPLLAARVMPILLGRTTRRGRPELVADLAKRIAEHDRVQVRGAIACVQRRRSILGELSRITQPTLVICGEEDTATVPYQSRLIHSQIGGSALALLPATGHLSALENPTAIARQILDFAS
jgi:pimeloyl-ACP methyl ester carboxylesterase